MQIECGVVTDQGTTRSRNEDNYLMGQSIKAHPDGREQRNQIMDTPCLVAVCDGMGGNSHGQEASMAAVESLLRNSQQLKSNLSANIMAEIDTLIQKANMDVVELKKNGYKAGTTLAMAYITDQEIVIANVGDSRVYQYANGELTRVSLDHNRYQELLFLSPQGQIKGKNELTQYLGIDPEDFMIEPHFTTLKNEECCLLLCSDGLTGEITEEEIKNVFRNNGSDSSDQIAQRFVQTAIDHGSKDNITAMVIKMNSQCL